MSDSEKLLPKTPPVHHALQISMAPTFHNFLVLWHGITALAAFVITIAVTTYALGGGCNPGDCQPMIHIASTFLSTSQISTGSGWAVATERSQIGDNVVQYPSDRENYAFSHYFECMDTAQMADKTCGGTNGVADFTFCLRNNTATSAALTACDAIPTAYPSHWPTPEEYLRCLFSYPAMVNSQNVRASQNVFRVCVQKTMWPFFEMQQGVDSSVFLGSFNWLIFLAVGMICMTSFAVYTVSFYEMGHVKHGEPQYCMRLGAFWAGLSTVWLVVFLGFFLAVAFRNNTAYEDNGGLPTTLTTSIVSLVMISVSLFYFGGELFESGYWRFYFTHTPLFDGESGVPHGAQYAKRAYGAAYGATKKVYKIVKRPFSKPNAESRLGAVMPDAGYGQYKIASVEEVQQYYTPPLIATWADGYLGDGCIFLGLAGATGQLTTALAWQIFVLVVFYRILNMMIARFMYECFMNNLSESVDMNTNKIRITNPEHKGYTTVGHDNDPPAKLSLKVMALSTQIAALYLVGALVYLVTFGNGMLFEFPPFYAFFWAGFIIPEVLRISLHVYCQIWEPSGNQVTWQILNPYMGIWCWDLAVRVIIICVVVFDVQSTPGTRKFLLDNSNALVRDYLPILYVAPFYAI